MQELDFTYDGIEASDIGIIMQSPFSFSRAVPRTQAIQVDGRSGDLHIEDGAFNNRTGTVACYIVDATKTAGTLNRNVAGKMDDVMTFLFQSNGYKKLQTSDDINHYWYARVANGGEISARLGLLNPFTIEFDCKPFRYTNDAEIIITVTSGESLTNPTGFKSYPLLFVDASDAGTLYNSSGTIDILEAGQYIIDCEDGRAIYGYTDGTEIYYSSQQADRKIHCVNFPYFYANESGLFFDNTITLQLQPRWRTL